MKKLLGALITAALAGCMVIPAQADARRVVTIGIDISDAQEAAMMRYFGVSADEVDIIYVNNSQEREYLGSYIPIEQIGYQTFSCAYVKPTTSGGIKVKTANLNYVTCNMIATTLSTCGVTNCQVVAAAPIEVSGTGALTGIILAYQQASGQTLDAEKVDLANREMVVTAELSTDVGQSNATAIVNEVKYQAIENNVTNVEEITNIVTNVSNEYNINIDNSQTTIIAELVSDIAQQDYEIEELKKTLAEVQANIIEDTDAPEEVQQQVAERQEAIEEAEEEKIAEELVEIYGEDAATEIIAAQEEEEENILDNTDASALSTDTNTVIESDTMSTVVEQETAEPEESEDDGWEVFDYGDNTDSEDSDGSETADTASQEDPAAGESADTADSQGDQAAGEVVDAADSQDDQAAEGSDAADSQDSQETTEENETVYTETDLQNAQGMEEEYDRYMELKNKLEEICDKAEYEEKDTIKEISDKILSGIINTLLKTEDESLDFEDGYDTVEDIFERRTYDDEDYADNSTEFIRELEQIVYETVSEDEKIADEKKEDYYQMIMDAAEEVYLPAQEELSFEESEDFSEDALNEIMSELIE